MNGALLRLTERVLALPPAQQEVLVPFLALAFELYVPGIVLSPELRGGVTKLLGSLALEPGASFQDARNALARRYRSVGLSPELVAALTRPVRSPSRRSGSLARGFV